ncbi:MAG: hypothetical protein Q8O51_00710 [bacterium]|nr:hypothetical protein [bacterium]
MVDQQTPPTPTSSAPLPPWLRKPTATPPPPVQTPVDIPGPWSRPAPLKPAAPAMPSPQSVPSNDATKDWGPIKPIRTVPKPDEKKVAYILAQTEHVVNPDDEHAQKKWIILGSIIVFLFIAGGTLAFVFFGRSTQTPKLDTNSVTIVNPRAKNGNASTNDVFPSANLYRNANSTNASSLVNPNQNANASNTNVATIDTDGDGLSNADELQYKTDARKPDTDGDGYTDGQEVQGGYNPLGTGKL